MYRILANFSEQFLISDAEREQLTRVCLEHAGGRIPLIVTISHFATDIAVTVPVQSSLSEAVMMMAPYHGALLKGTTEQTYEQLARVGMLEFNHDPGRACRG